MCALQAWPSFLLVYGLSSVITASINLGGESFHCYHLGSDIICKLLRHRLDLVQFLVGNYSHHTCRIVGNVSEDGLDIHTGLKLYDALSLCVGLLSSLRLSLLNYHMKWGYVSTHGLLAVSSQLSRNLASNRPQAYIWATKWSTLSLLVIVTRCYLH